MAGGVSAQNVLVGTPQQTKVVGAILRAPVGTALPTDLTSELNASFVGSGYISDAGVTVTPEVSTTDIKDWAGEVVRRLIETFTGLIEWEQLETSKESLENYFGEANVKTTRATKDHGTQIRAELRKDELPHYSWIFRVKDGDRRLMIVVEDGQITERKEVTFQSSDATKWGVKLSTFPGTDGAHAYILFDDGQKLPLTPGE